MITGHEGRPVAFLDRDYDETRVIDVDQYEHLLSAIDQKIEYTLKRDSLDRAVCDIIDYFADFKNAENIERGGRHYAS